MNKLKIYSIALTLGFITCMLLAGMSVINIQTRNLQDIKHLNDEFQEYRYNYYTPVPREFNDLDELKDWLYDNLVDRNEYVQDTYDCDDFSVDLVNDAREDGYLIYMMGRAIHCWEWVTIYDGIFDGICYWHFEYMIVSYGNHALCVTHVNGIWYDVEPQTDTIRMIGPEL